MDTGRFIVSLAGDSKSRTVVSGVVQPRSFDLHYDQGHSKKVHSCFFLKFQHLVSNKSERKLVAHSNT